MLSELLKHNNLGNKRELGFVLFHALDSGQQHKTSDLIRFCTSNLFSIGQSISGIISLLDFLSIVRVDKEIVTINLNVFNPEKFRSKDEYFLDTHFYACLINSLLESDSLKLFFNDGNLKFSHKHNRYYVKSNLIKFDFLPVRNLLLALNFFEHDQDVPDHLFIASPFTKFFKETVVDKFKPEAEPIKISLDQLNKGLKQKDEAGKQGELFALQFEQSRLKDHSNFSAIECITETYVNAGYDIRSFNDLDSFLHDRFIEVKSYNGEIAFYWSKNEVKTAKKLTTKYYLYLVDRLLIGQKGYVPKIFQDPYKKIFENEFWKKETENWKITLEE